jgi:hypothetical protein
MQPALPCDPAERVRRARAHHQIESETMAEKNPEIRTLRCKPLITRASNAATNFFGDKNFCFYVKIFTENIWKTDRVYQKSRVHSSVLSKKIEFWNLNSLQFEALDKMGSNCLFYAKKM